MKKENADFIYSKNLFSEKSSYRIFSLNRLLLISSIVFFIYSSLILWKNDEDLFALISNLWLEVTFGLLIIFISYLIRYFRWRLILKEINQSPPFFKDILIWFSSFAFTVTPGKSGEAVRLLLLKKEYKIPISNSLPSLLVERICDAISVLFFIVINIRYFSNWEFNFSIFSIYGLIAIFLILTILGNKFVVKNLIKIFPTFIGSRKQSFLLLNKFLRPITLIKLTIIGTIAWILEGISFFILLTALEVDHVDWIGATLAHTAGGLFGALTMLPGGIGSTEISTIWLLNLQGVSFDIASLATLMIRMMTLWFATLLGIFCLFLQTFKFSTK